MKKVIGIFATSNYMQTNDTFKDTYRYGNNYIKKIIECGAIPYLIPLCDDKVIMDSLEMCDALLLPGGSRVLPCVFDVIEYFYQNHKPILGICLGMQTLAMYSMKKDLQDKRIIKAIGNDTHWPVELLRDNNDTLVHKDYVRKDTKLYNILKQEEIVVNSVHRCTITEVGKDFDVSITSEDGLIEGIEYKGDDCFIIGVQFHPEILKQYNCIFEKFIENIDRTY